MENIKDRVRDLKDRVRRCRIRLIRVLKEKRGLGLIHHLKGLWLALNLMKDTSSHSSGKKDRFFNKLFQSNWVFM